MAIAPEIREALARFLPIHVVIGRAPGANIYQGLIEHSFSMDWSPARVLLWWSGKAYSILGEHLLHGDEEAEAQRARYAARKPDWQIEQFDALSDACPIEVDWAKWLALMTGGGNKFDKRNAIFSMKEGDK